MEFDIKKVLNGLKCLIMPVVVYALFAILSGGRFGTMKGMIAIARQSVLPTLITWAICNNMTLGVWDFSPGAVIALSGVVGGTVANNMNLGLAGLVLCIMLVSLVLTQIMFAIYHFARIPSMVTGLALLLIWETLTAVLFNGAGVKISRELTYFGKAPGIFYVLGVMWVVIYVLNNHTRFGYNVRSIGNGTNIARSIGVSLTKTRWQSFIVLGVFLGVASTVSLSISGSVKPLLNQATSSTAFDAIMGVFLGRYLARYCDLTIGTALGAFTMKMLGAGLLAIGLDSQLQQVATGAFLLIFIGISQNQYRIFERIETRKRASIAFAKQALR